MQPPPQQPEAPSAVHERLRGEVARLEQGIAEAASAIAAARAKERGPHWRELGCGLVVGFAFVVGALAVLVYMWAATIRG
jgi:hypothetical protein